MSIEFDGTDDHVELETEQLIAYALNEIAYEDEWIDSPQDYDHYAELHKERTKKVLDYIWDAAIEAAAKTCWNSDDAIKIRKLKRGQDADKAS